MSQINIVALEGNVTADAEVRHFGEKGVETSFTLANNTGFGDYKKTTFMKCKMYGARGEKVAQYINKGNHIMVSGNILIDSYEKDGERKYITYIKVDELSLGPKRMSETIDVSETRNNVSGKDDDIPF